MSPQVLFSFLQGCEPLEGCRSWDVKVERLFPYLGHQVIIICRHGVKDSAKGKHS